MLLLQRKVNQLVELSLDGRSLGTIMVTKILPESVWLGFEMPLEVEIVRDDAKDQRRKART